MKEGICTKLHGGDWLPILNKWLLSTEVLKLKHAPTPSLLSAAHLIAVLGWNRGRYLLKRCLPILPEIGLDGKRRCMFMQFDGVRCRNYSSGGICMNHAVRVVNYTQHFKSKDIRDTFNKFKTDPKKLQLDSELAMLRTLMTQVVNLCTASNGQMGMQGIQAATVLCDKIRQMIETISSMNKITPEYIDNLLSKVIDASAEYIDPNRLEEFAKRIQQMMMQEPEPDEPIEIGTKIEINGVEQTVEVEEENIQMRTLIQEHGHLLPPDELAELKKKHGLSNPNS